MFAGLLAHTGAPPPDSWVDVDDWLRTLHPFQAPDLVGHWNNGFALLVEGQRFNTPWSHHGRQAPWRHNHLAAAFWGRLDNRAALAAQLDIDAGRLETLPDAHLVLAAWRRWGETLPEHLLGDFALAIVDAKARQLFLVRDPLGVKPLYYWPHERGFLFATTVSAFRCLRGVEPTPDSDWMARYLVHLSMSHERTGYREILKLPPGHCLSVDSMGRSRLRRWHQWRDDAPPARRRDPQWLEAYREVLEEAVRCRMASRYPLGTENSGGIDSAGITAYLARLLGEPGDRLHSFGLALCDQEPDFILETSRSAGITHNHLFTALSAISKDDSERLERGLQVLGYPEEHANGSGHTLFYRECELRGIRTLFSGFGGDEVVTNPGSHLRWELLDGHNYRGLWDILPGNPLTRLLRLGKAVTLGRRELDSNPHHLQVRDELWPLQPLRPEVATRLQLQEAYFEAARYDAPFRRINDWIIDGLLQMPYIPTRLENCTLLAASYGVDYQWPLWDVRLVQQYLSTPSIEKVGPRGTGRYLHRCAIDGTVPHRVAWKPSKDMGYARLHLELADTGVKEIAEWARRDAARLHPALDELLDRGKWRTLIEQAAQGKVPTRFGLSFYRSAAAVQWLNHWLHGVVA